MPVLQSGGEEFEACRHFHGMSKNKKDAMKLHCG